MAFIGIIVGAHYALCATTATDPSKALMYAILAAGAMIFGGLCYVADELPKKRS